MSETQAEILYGATIVPVRSVAGSTAFYVETLDFERVFMAPDESVALVRRGPVHIQLLACADEAALSATANNISVYIEVEGLNSLFDALRARLEGLPDGRFRPPFEQPYGMREFHVKDPDGMLLFFGEDAQNG